MTYKNLIVEQDKNITILTINRPKSLNALNSDVLSELDSFLDAFIKQNKSNKNLDTQQRCLVITGSGDKAFVAGADIKEIDNLSADEAYSFAKKGQQVFRKIETLEVPVVAAVNGFALGGGFELVLCCDLVVATSSAQFGLPEAKLGLIPGFGGTVRLSRKISNSWAKKLMFTGEFLHAEKAFSLGLVVEIFDAENLLDSAKKMANKIIRQAPKSLSSIKSSLDEGGFESIDRALEIEAALFSRLAETKDRKEGTSAFIEKRKPVFTGQ